MRVKFPIYLSISICIHIIFIAALLYSPHVSPRQVLETLTVDLVDNETMPETKIPPKKPPEITEPDIPQKKKPQLTSHHRQLDTIGDPTKGRGRTLRKAPIAYSNRMAMRINRYWRYPVPAKHEGTVRVAVIVHNSGRLLKIILLKSSGYRDLDQSAIKAIKDASPFLPFTRDMTWNSVQHVFTFRYYLN